ncbi:MAG: sigma-70 family RNA polymerase sigma factor [Fimbriimonadaceae bacterium]|nr:sigma-70 family RNA polymerase sigma factor [Fimbriimonadaceae bacterium]
MSSYLRAMVLPERRMMDAATEEALLSRAKGRDWEAFGRIVDAYQGRVLGYIRRMVRDEEEAQDLAQEVFIRAYQSLDRFDGRASLRTWIFRIAGNLCIDRSRRIKRRPQTVAPDPEIEADDLLNSLDERWRPDRLLLDDELVACIDAAVDSLSDKLKNVLYLHDHEGLAYEEIAQALDVPVGTVKSRLFLARAHLQKQVQAYLGQGGEA